MLVIATGPSSVGKSAGLSHWVHVTDIPAIVVDLDREFSPVGLCMDEGECRPVLERLAERATSEAIVVDVGAGTQNAKWFWHWLDVAAPETIHVVIWAPANEVYLRNERLIPGRTFEDFEATEYGTHRHPNRGERIDVGGLNLEESNAKVATHLERLLGA